MTKEDKKSGSRRTRERSNMNNIASFGLNYEELTKHKQKVVSKQR